MVHQCVSEDLWFRNMLGIDVSAPPLPATETRRGHGSRRSKGNAIIAANVGRQAAFFEKPFKLRVLLHLTDNTDKFRGFVWNLEPQGASGHTAVSWDTTAFEEPEERCRDRGQRPSG